MSTYPVSRPRPKAFAFLVAGLLAAASVGCGDSEPAPQPDTIASASPAATDVVLRLGARDQLVAVSRFDSAPEVADLPRVGDANGIDWETVAQVWPATIAVGIDPSRLPAGDRERAEAMRVELLDVQVVQLADVFGAVRDLARAVGLDPAEAQDRWVRDLERAAGVEDQGKPSDARVLVLLDDDLSFVAGRGNYIDDLIAYAGGENAVPADFASWPTLDREALLSLDVDAVVLLLPGASDASLARAEAAWRALPAAALPAWEEVVVATEPYVMTPGWTGVETLASRLREAVEAADDEAGYD